MKYNIYNLNNIFKFYYILCALCMQVNIENNYVQCMYNLNSVYKIPIALQ